MIRKFFLNVSEASRPSDFRTRLEHPDKHWKFSAADINEREYWNDYMAAYEDMIRIPPPHGLPGTLCRQITSGSPVSWSRLQLWTRWKE